MSIPSVVMAVGDCQSYRKITVASLCYDKRECTSVSTEPSERRHFQGSKTRSSPDVVPIWAQDRHPGRPDMTVNLPSFLAVHPGGLDGSGLATQLRSVSRSDTVNSSNGTCDVIGFTDAALLHPNRTIDNLHIMSTNTAQQHESPGSTTVPIPLSSFTTPGSSNAIHTYHGADSQVQSMAQSTPTQSPQHVPRTARPLYLQEQRSYIMYHRIVKELSWPEIEDKFATLFNLRTSDGLTSMYYCIREKWGMQEVSKSQSYSVDDRSKVRLEPIRFRETS